MIENGKIVPFKKHLRTNEIEVCCRRCFSILLFDGEEIKNFTQHPPGEHDRACIEMVLGIKIAKIRDDLDTVIQDLKQELDAS